MAKLLYFLFLALPAGELLRRFISEDFGANPVEEITHFTGNAATYLLVFLLYLGPAKDLLLPWKPLRWFARNRRMLGLYVFFYAELHLAIWLLDQFLGGQELTINLIKPFILWGLAANLILTMMAATSLKALQRRVPWKKWHALVWLLPLLLGVHWVMKEEGDPKKAIIAFGPLLLAQAYRMMRARKSV